MGIFDDQSTSTSSTSGSTGQTGQSAQQQTGSQSSQVTGGTQATIPQFLAQHQQDVIGLGTQAAQQTGVAGLSTDEQAAIAQQRANQGNWTPGLSAAINLATTAATTPASQGISNYTNPFEQNQVADIERRANQNFQRRVMPGLAAAGIGSGGLGSQRLAQAYGEAAGDFGQNLAGQLGNLKAQNWRDALGASQADLARQSAGATQLGNFANQLQQQSAADVQSGLSAGALQRGLEQKAIDLPLEMAQKQANLNATLSPGIARGSTNWSSQAGQTASDTTGQTAANTQQQSDTTTRGTQGKSTASQLLGALGLLGNNRSALGGIFGGGGGGGGGWLSGQGGGGGRNAGGGWSDIFGGLGGNGGWEDYSGGNWDYADPYEGGYSGDWGDYGDEGSYYGYAKGGAVKMADGGAVDPALSAMLQTQQLGLNQLQQKQEKQLGFGDEEAGLFAEGGMAQGENNVDPMQALDVLAQAGCPPELLQQCAQSIQGGQGGGEMGGAPAGGPPPMACGGLAHMNMGGMAHMNQGGGAYGVDPEMVRRLMAATGGRNPMGGQPSNPMAPGHFGSGPAQMTDAGGGPGRMDMIRRREESMRGMHASPMAR